MINKIIRKVKRTINPNSDPRNYLLSQMPKNGVCAEIGSWKGDFTQKILQKTSPKKITLVDPYMYVADYENAWYGGSKGSQAMMDEIHDSVAERFKSQIQAGQVEIKRSPSKEGLLSFEDESLDWVYIDGDHTYEFVVEDLKASWGKVKVGGFITGDDYHDHGWWKDGVMKAVDEFIEEKKDSIGRTFFKGTQFAIEKIDK